MTSQQRNVVIVALAAVFLFGCCGCPCTIGIVYGLTDDPQRSSQPPWMRPDRPGPGPFEPDDDSQPCPPDGPCPRRPTPSPYGPGPYSPNNPSPYGPYAPRDPDRP